MRLPGSVLQGILARAALVFLRIYLGFAFLLSAWLKLQSDNSPVVSGFPWYQEFLRRVMLSNADIIAAALTGSELLVGITLVLGLLTRFFAVVALVLTAHYMLASGTWNDAGLAAISIALLIGAAGRTLGLDSMLARRWPRSPLW
jgi:uncharacterized membrane protein YphA (DoxX/SURF4 family)